MATTEGGDDAISAASTMALQGDPEQEAFKTLLHKFIGVDENHPAYVSLKSYGITTVDDLISQEDRFFLELSTTIIVGTGAKAKEKQEPVVPHKRNLLIYLKHYLLKVADDLGHLCTADEIGALEKGEFDMFRVRARSIEYFAVNGASLLTASASATKGTSTTAVAALPTSTSSAALNFKKGIKRDVTHYPVLKDGRYFNTFEMELKTLARAHDVDEVFNPDYHPLTKEDQELFAEKQKFAMSILVHSIKTDMGLSFVRQHITDYNAQECWKKIINEAKKSTRAELEVSSLQDKIINSRLDTHWKGSASGFLLFWKEQVRKLEDILPSNQHYHWTMKKRLLRAAVNGHPHLAQVDKMDQDQISRKMPALSFEQYFDILLSSAAQVDFENSVNKRPLNNRVVNYLDLSPEEYDELSGSNGVDFNINKAQQGSKGAGGDTKKTSSVHPNSLYVPYGIWEQLTPRIQKLIKDARDSGGGHTTSSNEGTDDNEDNGGEEEATREVNFHGVSTVDLTPKEGETLSERDSRLIFNHLSGREVMDPGDIRRVLSASQDRRMAEVREERSGAAKATKQGEKKTVTINGVVYTPL